MNRPIIMRSGDRVRVIGKHPHAGATGTLIAFEHYGPAVLKLSGWRVKLDDGRECYVRRPNVARA